MKTTDLKDGSYSYAISKITIMPCVHKEISIQFEHSDDPMKSDGIMMTLAEARRLVKEINTVLDYPEREEILSLSYRPGMNQSKLTLHRAKDKS